MSHSGAWRWFLSLLPCFLRPPYLPPLLLYSPFLHFSLTHYLPPIDQASTMSSSPFSSINTVVRPASASTSTSQEKPSTPTHNHNSTLKTCSLSFLGSTHKLRSSPITSSIRRPFSSSIVAVSDVVNKNTSKSETSPLSSSNLVIDLSFLYTFSKSIPKDLIFFCFGFLFLGL